MSQAQDFMERVQSDEALREQVTGLGQNMQAVLDLAKREGYNFTQDDFVAALRERGYEVGMELSEEDLAQVAGGTETEMVTPACTTICPGMDTEWPDC